MKRGRLRSTMALTMRPLTDARYILRKVLMTRKTESSVRSKTSGEVQEGMTILTSFFILAQKMPSTCPLPPCI